MKMNERLKELMIRAISDVDSIDDPETRRMYIPNCFAEKFAELLIGECAEVAGCNVHVSGFALGDLIKQHFGIEE
jgi:hypothetical protein